MQEGDVVGTGEIGVISYLYNKGPVLDLCGLTDNGVLHIIKEAGMVAPVQQLRPEWLLLKDSPSPVQPVAKEAWFSDWYEKKIVLGDSVTKLGIYQYIELTN
ncbi:MAG: hypothetical protein ACI9UK_000535 [Candidatus Krumholzibacteriia bacterium]